MLLKKLLFQTKKQTILIVAFLGALLGMAFLLVAINFFVNINQWMKKDDSVFGANTVIIQKRISNFNSLNMSNSSFVEDEIEEIKNLDFVEEIAAFENNTFDVSLKLADQGNNMPYFRTDMFLQSLPQKYLDIAEDDWYWDEKTEVIPLIMPEDYLTLYNHGFAVAQGLPQISKEAFTSALFELEIKSSKNNKKYLARVVHLSSKINSVLVPQSFLHFANNEYGTGNEKDPSRLILVAKEDQFAALEAFVKERNLDVNQSVINYAKIKSYVKILLSVILFIGIVILILSFTIFILYSMMIIVKTEYEIKTLLRIGYAVKTISKKYMLYFSKIFGVISLSSIGVVVLVNFILNPYTKNYGFDSSLMPNIETWISMLVIFILFIILNKLNIDRNIKNLGD